jgi:hypothetical protein
MRTHSVLLLVALAAGMRAQSPQPAHALKTFTSPDGVFQFNYSDTLIVCQQQKQEWGGYAWVPSANCVAYHAVCDGLTPEKYEGLACLAYPRNQHTDAPAFEAATFSVEILEKVATAKTCTAKPDVDTFTSQPPIDIHGISFVALKYEEAGMNQSVSGNVYRTFHSGKCYQLGINRATANAQVFDPPAREMTKRDWADVNRVLQRARDSFRFLK